MDFHRLSSGSGRSIAGVRNQWRFVTGDDVKKLLTIGLGVVTAMTAVPAQAQQTLVFDGSWGVGAVSSWQSTQNVRVRISVTNADIILGEHKIYVVGEFCNESGGFWSGGQRISNVDRGTSHAGLSIPYGQCRSWAEWVSSDTQRIYVFVRRDR